MLCDKNGRNYICSYTIPTIFATHNLEDYVGTYTVKFKIIVLTIVHLINVVIYRITVRIIVYPY